VGGYGERLAFSAEARSLPRVGGNGRRLALVVRV
jgi:hypothetical protein